MFVNTSENFLLKMRKIQRSFLKKGSKWWRSKFTRKRSNLSLQRIIRFSLNEILSLHLPMFLLFRNRAFFRALFICNVFYLFHWHCSISSIFISLLSWYRTALPLTYFLPFSSLRVRVIPPADVPRATMWLSSADEFDSSLSRRTPTTVARQFNGQVLPPGDIIPLNLSD